MKIFGLEKKYCYTPKCKATCCVSAPLPRGLINENQDKLARKLIGVVPAPMNNRYCVNADVPITTVKALESAGDLNIAGKKLRAWRVKSLYVEGNYCPFLRRGDYKCNIYENRPPICRSFGTPEGHKCSQQINVVELYARKTLSFFQKLLKMKK